MGVGGKVGWMEGKLSKNGIQAKPPEGSNSTLAYPGLRRRQQREGGVEVVGEWLHSDLR
jgi:hypothetical protein